ncbi:MAG: glycosyltransferase family A protein [Burkholderiales bacterium]
MQPLVSILIPAYNAEKWLADTIRSALQQTWPHKEVIVIDDGSNDRTLVVARKFESLGVKVFSQSNQGPVAARNAAYSQSRGEYIQWLDADDLLEPGKVAAQIVEAAKAADKHLLLSCAWGSFYALPQKATFVPSPLWADLTPVEWLLRKMQSGCFMQTATWLVSRELSEAAGPWDPRMLVDNDGEYFCRVLLKSTGVRFVKDARVLYRRPNVRSVSFIGNSRGKMDAHLLSCELHLKYIRSLEDSQRVRTACNTFLKAQMSHSRPWMPEHVERAKQLFLSVDGQFEPHPLNWPYSWIQKLGGPQMANAVRSRVPHLIRSVKRVCERVAYRFGG